MTFTWGFIFIFLLLIVPGLLIRRLYFFGDFSKQFGIDQPLLKTFAYSLIPGIINFAISLLVYHWWFGVSSDELYQYYQTANGLENLDNDDFSKLSSHLIKFLLFTFVIAFITGFLSGRIVRIFRLDTINKFFRYKNHWFYLFAGEVARIKKYRNQIKIRPDEKFLFTRADVLISTNNGNKLYSGILVDYHLEDSNSYSLKNVILKNAVRYKKLDKEEDSVVERPVPGSLFVLSCKNILNINLTYVYTKQLFGNYAKKTTIIFAIINTLLFPVFVFKIGLIDLDFYHKLFENNFLKRLVFYLTAIQFIIIFNPYYQYSSGETKYFRKVTKKLVFFRFLILVLLFLFSMFLFKN